MPGKARTLLSYDEIDSDALPAGRRFARWRETGLLPMTAEPADDDGRRRFRIRVRRLAEPGGRFIELAATPMKLSRTASDYGRDRLDMISLTLFLGTEVECVFGSVGSSVRLRPGQIGVKDFTRPTAALWQREPHRGLNLHLPRLTVEAAVGSKIAQLHGAVLSPSALAPMLRLQLLALASITPRAADPVRAAALEAAVDLACSVLRCELGSRLEDEANDAGLYAAAQLFVGRHLASPRLSPGVIARQLRCSRAHLYRVFARRGETVAAYVRERRLLRARELLVGPPERNKRIGDIAYCCGFEDPVHFARLVRERFGLSPRDLRAGGRLPRDGPSAGGDPRLAAT
jgi:AraC-like DNA-binding protein